MTIQDLVLAAANLGLALSLIPTLRNKGTRIPRWTSMAVSTFLFLMAGTFFSLGLYTSTLTMALNGAEWVFLFLFRALKSGQCAAILEQHTGVGLYCQQLVSHTGPHTFGDTIFFRWKDSMGMPGTVAMDVAPVGDEVDGDFLSVRGEFHPDKGPRIFTRPRSRG